MNAVVVKPDHLGDFAVGLPALWEASRRVEQLWVLASPANAEWSEILPWLPNVRAIHYPKYARNTGTDWRRLGTSLAEVWGWGRAQGGFDWGIELTSWDAAPWGKLFLRAAGARRRRGTAVRGQGWLVDEAVVARGGVGHQSERLAARFPRAWGVRGTAAPAEFMPAEWRWAPARGGERAIAVMPWAGETFKEWPVGEWRKLRAATSEPWRLVAPPDRLNDAAGWREAVGPARVEIVAVRGIRDSLRVLGECAVTLSVDTAAAHYAWLVGAPLVELFSTAADPAQWGSLARGEVIAARESQAGLSLAKKRRAGPELMRHVTLERVMEALRDHL